MPGCTMEKRKATRSIMMLRETSCWETLGPGIRVDVTLTTHLIVVGDQIHLFMATVLSNIIGLLQQHNAFYYSAKIAQEWLEEHD